MGVVAPLVVGAAVEVAGAGSLHCNYLAVNPLVFDAVWVNWNPLSSGQRMSSERPAMDGGAGT